MIQMYFKRRQRTFWIVNIIITFCNVNVVVSKQSLKSYRHLDGTVQHKIQQRL